MGAQGLAEHHVSEAQHWWIARGGNHDSGQAGRSVSTSSIKLVRWLLPFVNEDQILDLQHHINTSRFNLIIWEAKTGESLIS